MKNPTPNTRLVHRLADVHSEGYGQSDKLKIH